MYLRFGIIVFEEAILLSLQLVKVVKQGANVPEDHSESLLHLRPPAVGVVKGSPELSESGLGLIHLLVSSVLPVVLSW